jgi:hypothetical protein
MRFIGMFIVGHDETNNRFRHSGGVYASSILPVVNIIERFYNELPIYVFVISRFISSLCYQFYRSY